MRHKSLRFLRKTLCMLQIAALLFSVMPGLSAYAKTAADTAPADDDTKTETEFVEITGADDLAELSARCSLDSASANLYVTLTQDIDLEGTSFEGIRIFAGVFDGKGHTIRGYHIEGDGYADGFFRYIAEGGFVQNLTLVGQVDSQSVEEYAGGICGINRGSIIKCNFKGLVNGEVGVGGICGDNTSTGIIRECYVSGVITGSAQIGGIAGVNHGTIDRCISKAGVDAELSWIEQQDADGLEWVRDLLSTETSETRLVGITDIGGICGYSDGLITDCVNSGVVGYEHSGYNVGGICGRQAGLLTACSNNGPVFGRKDVGGIVGQMEPYICVDEAKSIGTAVEELHDLVDQLLSDMDNAEGAISSDIRGLSDHATNAATYGNNIGDALTDFANENIDSANDLQERIEYVLNHLPDITENLEKAEDSMDLVIENLRRVADDLEIVSKLQNSPYNEADHARLSLVSGVGGNLRTSAMNPAKGESVTVTAEPDNGYALKSIMVRDAGGTEVAANKSGNQISFTMPEPNVVVTAEFSYIGKYMASSNAGGTIAVKDDGSTITIRVIPDKGYDFDSVSVGNTSYGKGEFTLEGDVYNLTIPAIHNGKSVPVSTIFSEMGQGYAISIVASTGGYVTADRADAAAGDVVYLTVHEYSGYKGAAPVITPSASVTATGKLNEYSFVMPAGDVTVTEIFTYPNPAEDETAYAVSTSGGRVSLVRNPGNNNYLVTLIPDGGYDVDLTTPLTLTGKGQGSVAIPGSDLTENTGNYSYTFNSNDYAHPIEVKGYFVKKPAATYPIVCVDGTGGTVASSSQSAAAGDEVFFTAVPSNGYRVASLSVHDEDNDTSVIYTGGNMEDTYSFTMPAGKVKIVASFAPVEVIVESNAGGDAGYIVEGNTVKLTVSPNSGYGLSGHPTVTDASGKNVPLSRKNAGTYVYEFSLSGILSPAHVQINFVRISDYDTVEQAKDTIEKNADYLSQTMDDVTNTMDELEDLLTDEDGDYLSYDQIITDTDKTTKIGALLIELGHELADAGSEAAEMTGALSTILTVLTPYAEDAAKTAREDVKKALDELEVMNRFIKAATDSVTSIVDNLNARATLRFSSLAEEFSEDLDGLFDELKAMSASLDAMATDADIYSDKITGDMRAINDQMQDIWDMILDDLEGTDEESIRDRIIGEEPTDEEIDNATTGKVKRCINNAPIQGDINVGGITGAMSIDAEDPEGSAAGSVTWSLANNYHSTCILDACINNGSILAKKNGAGAIAGYMNLGVILRCEAYGSVESTEGNYVGGICGESHGVLRNNFSLCELRSEQSYIGGVCGYGTVVRDCYAMTIISGDGKHVGEIAGQIDLSNSAEGIISPEDVCRNYYVSSQWYGIDDISYVGIAEPVTYESLLVMPGIPESFRHLNLIFEVDGNVLKHQDVAYGEDLGDIALPLVPERKGFYGRWEDLSGRICEGNLTVRAEYYNSITTLQSESGVEDTSYNGEENAALSIRPYVLLDGVFDDSLRIYASVADADVPEELVKGKTYVVYHVWIEGSSEEGLDSQRLRLLHEFEAKETKVYRLKGSTYEQLPSSDYGSYVQTLFEGREATYLIVSADFSLDWKKYALPAGGVVGGTVALIVVVRLLSGKKKKKKAKEDAPEKEE